MKSKVLSESEKAELERLEMIIAMWRPNTPRGRELLGIQDMPRVEHKPKPNKTSYVYFIRSGGKIKIGVTTNLPQRVNSIQAMSPCKVELLTSIKGSRAKERDLHYRFRHLREHGEWFRVSDDLISYIEEIQND